MGAGYGRGNSRHSGIGAAATDKLSDIICDKGTDKPTLLCHIRAAETDHSTKGRTMSEDDRITIIAESFEAAGLEFHRCNLASEAYRMVGPISMQRFERMNGPKREMLFDSNPMFAVTFAKEGN